MVPLPAKACSQSGAPSPEPGARSGRSPGRRDAWRVIPGNWLLAARHGGRYQGAPLLNRCSVSHGRRVARRGAASLPCRARSAYQGANLTITLSQCGDKKCHKVTSHCDKNCHVQCDKIIVKIPIIALYSITYALLACLGMVRASIWLPEPGDSWSV